MLDVVSFIFTLIIIAAVVTITFLIVKQLTKIKADYSVQILDVVEQVNSAFGTISTYESSNTSNMSAISSDIKNLNASFTSSNITTANLIANGDIAVSGDINSAGNIVTNGIAALGHMSADSITANNANFSHGVLVGPSTNNILFGSMLEQQFTSPALTSTGLGWDNTSGKGVITRLFGSSLDSSSINMGFQLSSNVFNDVLVINSAPLSNGSRLNIAQSQKAASWSKFDGPGDMVISASHTGNLVLANADVGIVMNNSNVGINTNPVFASLDVNGNIAQRGNDFFIGIGQSASQSLDAAPRFVAISADSNSVLAINRGGGFSGGVRVDTGMRVLGAVSVLSNIDVGGSLRVKGHLDVADQNILLGSTGQLCFDDVCVNKSNIKGILLMASAPAVPTTIPTAVPAAVPTVPTAVPAGSTK